MDRITGYINKNKWLELLLFILVFWAFIVYLQLNRGMSDMIPGYHYWRKTDTYAQIMNYYYNGLNFFDHSIYFNQMGSNAKALAEFPLFYYCIAIQKKLLGNHDIILKINWLVVLFLGQFSLFKIALHYTKNYILSLVAPFLLFLSPVFTIYCLEYLPDPIALSFSFIGLYFLLLYNIKSKRSLLILALLFISLSGLMKPFFLIPYIAFVGVFIGRKIILKENILKHWFYLIPFGLIAGWFFYVGWYNASVNSHYFLSDLRPFWAIENMPFEAIKKKITEKWMPQYFHPTYLSILTGILGFNLVWRIKKYKHNVVYVLFSLLGTVMFIILFFNMLRDHDYYIFPILFLIPLTAITLLKSFSDLNLSGYITSGIGLILIVFIFIDSDYSWNIRQNRLKSPNINSFHTFEDYIGLDQFLSKNSVNKNDLVIAYSDKSPSYALSLLNRKGWSGYQTFYRRMHVNELMARGADYLIINKNEPMMRDSVALEGVNMEYIADTNQIFIYKLVKE